MEKEKRRKIGEIERKSGEEKRRNIGERKKKEWRRRRGEREEK